MYELPGTFSLCIAVAGGLMLMVAPGLWLSFLGAQYFRGKLVKEDLVSEHLRTWTQHFSSESFQTPMADRISIPFACNTRKNHFPPSGSSFLLKKQRLMV